jgi:hypothetical protein
MLCKPAPRELTLFHLRQVDALAKAGVSWQVGGASAAASGSEHHASPKFVRRRESRAVPADGEGGFGRALSAHSQHQEVAPGAGQG